MQTMQSWGWLPVRRLAAVALVGSLPALAAVKPLRQAHVPAASNSAGRLHATASVPPGAPAKKKPASARSTPLRAAEVERLAAHISKTWKKPLPQARRIVRAASVHAHKHRLPPTLVLAVVAQESSFRPAARSGYGAQGLMQVVARHHPEKVKGIGRKGLLDPETNIAVGTRVLAEYVERDNGRLDTALIRYSGKAGAYPAKVQTVWANLEQVRSDADASA